MQIDKNEILEYIPQREPMVMVNSLLENSEKLTKTSLLISSENIFCKDGVFREPGLIENMAQTAAVRAGHFAKQNNKKVRTGFIGAIKNLKINILPKVNQTIYTELKSDYEYNDFSIVSAKVFYNEEIAAECEMKIILI